MANQRMKSFEEDQIARDERILLGMVHSLLAGRIHLHVLSHFSLAT